MINKCFSKIKSIIKSIINRFCIKKAKATEVSIADLFFMHLNRNNEFTRYDTIVRYITIEKYYANKSDAFELYAKMQDLRIGKGYAKKAIEKFKALLESYKINGYDRNSKILLDNNLNLVDGSHRFAMGLYFKGKTICANILNQTKSVENYSIDWFIAHNFTNDEIDLLRAKETEIKHTILESQTFSCIIWAPAVQYQSEILKDLKYYGKIISIREYQYRPAEYNNIVRAIYAIDNIEKWKIEKKIEHMQNYPSKLIAINMYFSNPDYRQKKLNLMPLSRIGERLKKAIRNKYQTRIKDYYFDIIMHIGDNLLQCDYMHNILENQINIEPILDSLNNYKYALVKLDSPYLPIDFPKTLPIGKDLDIICSKEDFSPIRELLFNFAKSLNSYSYRIIDTNNNTRIRIEQNECLIIQFDISYSMEYRTDSFFENALKKRVFKKSYYTLDPIHEYIYRMCEYSKKPLKKQHEFYLKTHLNDYSKELAYKYCPKKLEELLAKTLCSHELDEPTTIEETIAKEIRNYCLEQEKVSQYYVSNNNINWDKVFSLAYPIKSNAENPTTLEKIKIKVKKLFGV